MRQNPRGYFLKLTQSTPTLRKFVAIPAEILYKFEENFVELLDRYGPSQDETSPPSEFGFSLFFATGFYLFFFLFAIVFTQDHHITLIHNHYPSHTR